MKSVPWYIKVVVGLGAAVFIAVKTPILEIAQMFIVVVMLPLTFIASLGLVGQGVVEALGSNMQGTLDSIKEKFKTKLAEHREDLSKQPDTSLQ